MPLDVTLTTNSPQTSHRLPFWVRHTLARLRLHCGSLNISLPDGASLDLIGERPGPAARLVLRRNRALRRLLFGGVAGFSEAFVDGDWDSPDLPTLIELAARNEQANPLPDGLSLLNWLNHLRHRLNANTRRGSRRNISAHYDLGNSFYRHWLDPSMMYSSGLYTAESQTLEQAQQAKLERVLDLLDPHPGQSLLEIGCGWGGFAALAVERGLAVTGLTLSTEQLAWAHAHLKGRADLRLQDYRDVQGRYDRIASIEMLEAVGEENWPTYFQTLRQCLKPGGVAVLQVITIAEDRFESYRRGADFIQRHIFPGGLLPTVSAIGAQARQAGLALTHQEDFGPSYARTLAEWRSRFHRAWPVLQGLGFDQRFYRLWDYYLAYCEGGFRARSISVGFYRLEG